METSSDPWWSCEAYGLEGIEAGALCFFAGALFLRVCSSEGQCAARLEEERRRVFRRIQELAALGDPVMVQLAAEFAAPDQLLGP
jgi:hypothetical protein